MAIRITCIKKSGGYHQDPHHAIQYIGWLDEATGKTGENTREEIYNWLKNQSEKAYVKDRNGNKAYVGTRENQNGTHYLQTYADGVWTDNLLALPECVA